MFSLSMKLSFVNLILFGVYLVSTENISKYESKYDNVDLDEILKSKRLMDNYIKCLTDDGPCTPDAKTLKDNLPDAIETHCMKCTEKQKYGSEKVIRFIIDKRPDDWKYLETRYDPEGKYKKQYLDEKQKNATLEENHSK